MWAHVRRPPPLSMRRFKALWCSGTVPASTSLRRIVAQRHQKDLIYTCIGSVGTSRHPYRDTGLCTDDCAKMYSNVNLCELPPDVHGVAGQACRPDAGWWCVQFDVI